MLVHPGTYRERVLPYGGMAGLEAPTIVIEGTDPGRVVIAGSDVWTGWTSVALDVLHQAWPYAYGLSPIPIGWDSVAADLERAPVVRRREVVFVDGTLLRQVMTPAEVMAQPGTHHLTDAAVASDGSLVPGALTVHLAAGVRYLAGNWSPGWTIRTRRSRR